MTKDQTLMTIAVIILLFTAMIDWNIYSWLTLVAITIILYAWYFKKTDKPKTDPTQK
jgi:Ca2+/Na+ antiporter